MSTAPSAAWKVSHWIALLLLCAAYLQGGIDKALDFSGAIAEMTHFGLAPPAVFAVLVIVLELGAPLAILSGVLRWAGALALALFTLGTTLLAVRFWELPPSQRLPVANTFFEHLSPTGGFLLVAWYDWRKHQESVHTSSIA